MGYPVDRGALVRRALREADVDASVFDLQGDGWLSQEEVEGLVAKSSASFYDFALDILGPESFAKEFINDFGPNIQPPPFMLPTDFYRLVSVHVCDQSATPTGPTPFERFESVEPVSEQGPTMTELLNTKPADGPFYYQLRRERDEDGQSTQERLHIWPYPTRDRFLRVLYAPAFNKAPGGINVVIDGVNGWDDWVVLDVAAAILRKEGSSVADVVNERERVESRIRGKSGKQDTFRPRTPIDVRGVRGGRWPR